MKLFLDAHIDGMVKYLRALDVEATSAALESLSNAEDVELIDYCIEYGYTFVTRNEDAAKMAAMKGARHILIDMAFMANRSSIRCSFNLFSLSDRLGIGTSLLCFSSYIQTILLVSPPPMASAGNLLWSKAGVIPPMIFK